MTMHSLKNLGQIIINATFEPIQNTYKSSNHVHARCFVLSNKNIILTHSPRKFKIEYDLSTLKSKNQVTLFVKLQLQYFLWRSFLLKYVKRQKVMCQNMGLLILYGFPSLHRSSSAKPHKTPSKCLWSLPLKFASQFLKAKRYQAWLTSWIKGKSCSASRNLWLA